jgi:hypothetical protein
MGSWFLMHLCSTTKFPWNLSHQTLVYIHTSSLLVRLYGTNKASVTEVLETSWFVYFIQTCGQFHRVIQVTKEICSSSKFSRWLPFVCCPRLHVLLFTQYKPPIPINRLTFIIESLRASVTLMATYLIWLVIKPRPTNDFTIYGGITNSFAIFAVMILQKFCV